MYIFMPKIESSKFLFFIAILFFQLNLYSNENRLDREPKDYKFTFINFSFLNSSDDSGLALKGSLNLPGSFYISAERMIDGVDYKSESYDKVTDSLRLGVEVSISDLVGSVAAESLTFVIRDWFNVFVEAGIKSSELDAKGFDFSGDDKIANLIGGIRIGNSNSFEARIYFDVSKETTIIDGGDPVCQGLDICPPYRAELADESDTKIGLGILYNLSKRNALTFNITQSSEVDSIVRLGFQYNF